MAKKKTNKKWLRILRNIGLTLLTILGILIVFILCGGLGPTVKWCAPIVAKSMGADLSIERCVILPLGGYVCIEGVQIENPETFRTANPDLYAATPLARIGKCEIDFAMLSLFKSEYVVDKIELTGLRALYAFDLDTTNVDALIKEMGLTPAQPDTTEEAVAETETPAATAEDTDTSKSTTKPVRLAYVHLEDNSVTIRKFMNIPMPLPPLTLTNTGTNELREKLDAMITPIKKVFNGVGNTLGKGLDVTSDAVGAGAEAIGSRLEKTKDVLGDGVDKTTEALGEGAKALGEGVKSIGTGIKGLFSK